MLNFNNTITSKIIALIIAVLFFLADVSYAGAYQQGGLRVPVGRERTYDRVKELEEAQTPAAELESWAMGLLRKANILDYEMRTDDGFYAWTPFKSIPEINDLVSSFNLKGPVLLDAGSGRGLFALCIARSHPRMTVIGIESEGTLHRDSLALKGAALRNGISSGQVKFVLGRFDNPKFADVFKSADIIYYNNWGTRDAGVLAETIRDNMKIGGRFICLHKLDETALVKLFNGADFEYEKKGHGITVIKRTHHKESKMSNPSGLRGSI